MGFSDDSEANKCLHFFCEELAEDAADDGGLVEAAVALSDWGSRVSTTAPWMTGSVEEDLASESELLPWLGLEAEIQGTA